MKRFGVALSVLLAVGCGPRHPEAAANQTYYWHVDTSDVTFGACSDEPQFRKDLGPLEVKENQYYIYKVAKDAKTAVTQACTTLDSASCKPAEPPVVFTVAIPELIFSDMGASDFVPGCQLADTITWTLTDKGAKGSLEIAHVLSLAGDPTACAAGEAQFKLQSPNMLGLEGCVVTFSVGLTLN